MFFTILGWNKIGIKGIEWMSKANWERIKIIRLSMVEDN
jgi:hypothetical protein